MGIGAVCHTLNPRLSPADICYIANHSQDKLILADLTFLPILGRIHKQLPQLQGIIVLTDRWAGGRAGTLFAAGLSSPLGGSASWLQGWLSVVRKCVLAPVLCCLYP